jgi:hypothetical protein
MWFWSSVLALIVLMVLTTLSCVGYAVCVGLWLAMTNQTLLTITGSLVVWAIMTIFMRYQLMDADDFE